MTVDELAREAAQATRAAVREVPLRPVEELASTRRWVLLRLAAAATVVAVIVVAAVVTVIRPNDRTPATNPTTTTVSVSTAAPGGGPFDSVILPVGGLATDLVLYTEAGLEFDGRTISLHHGLDSAPGRSIVSDGDGGVVLLTAERVVVYAPAGAPSRAVVRFEDAGEIVELLGVFEHEGFTWLQVFAPDTEHPIEIVLLDEIEGDRFPAWPPEEVWPWTLGDTGEPMVRQAGLDVTVRDQHLVVTDGAGALVDTELTRGAELFGFDGRRILLGYRGQDTTVFSVLDVRCGRGPQCFTMTEVVGNAGATLMTAYSPVAPAPATTTAVAAADFEVWGIAHPASWYRAGPELMPALASPRPMLTVATVPLTLGGNRCGHMPDAGLRDLGPGDVLISIFRLDGLVHGALPWPEAFSDDTFPPVTSSDAHECAGRSDLEVHWDVFELQGDGLHVLVAFGPDTGPETRQVGWSVLDSLRTDLHGDGAANACIITLPSPNVDLPQEESVMGVPYGTPQLFTRIPGEGPVWAGLPSQRGTLSQKVFFWSESYADLTQPVPPIEVSASRLDDPSVPVVDGTGTTSGGTADEGSFMLVGLEFPSPGCWEIRADLDGSRVTYVAAVP